MSSPLPHVHWHRHIAEQGPHLYYECRCGSRRLGRKASVRGGYAPVDRQWLAGGDWTIREAS